MKNIIKNSLVIVVMCTTLFGNADTSILNTKNDSRTTLTLTNVKRGNELSIKDADGIILYKEIMENSGNYMKGFDLTELPNGNYFFELDKGMEIKTIPFTVEATKVEFDEQKESIFHKPLVRSNKNLIYVSKLALDEQPLDVDIYYNNEYSSGFELIHSETLGNSKNIKRVYGLNLNEKGNYKIVTKTEGRSFINYVKL